MPDAPPPTLTAHRVGGPSQTMKIVPGPRWRAWMDATYERWANRCLPLLMANESGWVLLNPTAFSATWSGGDSPEDVTIASRDELRKRRFLAQYSQEHADAVEEW